MNLGTISFDVVANVTTLERSTKQAVENVDKMADRFTAAGKRMQAVGRSMTRAITLPAAAFGGLSVKAFGDFNHAMIESTAIMETTERQSEQMAKIDRVDCVGPLMEALWEALPQEKRGAKGARAGDLAERAHHLVDAGDVVLVKGSKGSRVSLVADALRKLGRGRG